MDKALIAMSGGVDSSAAALVMKNGGFSCEGALMRLCGEINEASELDAKKVCQKLEIPFHVFDMREIFREKVIEKFVKEYENCRTPNPCIDCNKNLKFGAFFEKADELGCKYVVTGHYARVTKNEKTGLFELKKAADPAKDQSYVLYFLTQKQLSRLKFPLGDFSGKEEVRALAQSCGLDVANKRESQDICFIPDKDHARFIENFTKKSPEPGDLVHQNGEILGKHKGLFRYTIGQRKGLGIAYSEPLYVVKKDLSGNRVILSGESGLYSESLLASDFNWLISEIPFDNPISATAVTRYRGKENKVRVKALPNNFAEIRFETPQKAVCPGQAVVLYEGEKVIGGGTIT